jgi:8-oxo-dGTP diphosphatase
MSKVIVADAIVDLKRGVNYVGITVVFAVHDGKGNILLQKRSQKCRDEQGTWCIAGGALEFGERLEDAVRREVKEEFGVDALEIKLLNSYEVLRINNGVPTHWMAFTHSVLVNPDLVLNNEPVRTDEIGWFTSQNLPSPLHSQFHNSFDAALAAEIVK